MNDFLIHYGIPGQKWGVRRFQNEDGTLTEEGKTRYGKGPMPEKYKTEDIQQDAKKFRNLLENNYAKYKDENGQVSISDKTAKFLIDSIKSDSQVVKYERRQREKQQKYNAALQTLDLNRRINTYNALNQAQKDWKLATLGAMFRSVQKLPRDERDRAYGWLYIKAPRIFNAINDDLKP